MDKELFLERQYLTIREEIKETKARIFRLAWFGSIGMPLAYLFAATFKTIIIFLCLPIMICTFILLFTAESRALMRAGKFIKNSIEGQIFGGEMREDREASGWETWLEQEQERRHGSRVVDKLLAFFFYVLFGFYYTAAVYLASVECKKEWGDTVQYVSILMYIAIGIFFLIFLARNYTYSTSTKEPV